MSILEGLTSTALCYQGGALKILDQTLLPHEERWLTCQTVDELCEIICSLRVRGAPLIGVSVGLMLGHLAACGADLKTLQNASARLRATRPTAVNLMNSLDRLAPYLSEPEKLIQEAKAIFLEDQQLCENIAKHGVSLFRPKSRIMTVCNTGGLATAGIGTAFGVIRRAHEEGLDVHVTVCETRPLLQGARLTAWECLKFGIPHTLITDNMAAYWMQQGRVDAVMVGADRIAANGDFANKVGTYMLAVLARAHGIPFYVAAPFTTLDPKCPSALHIEIEKRSREEVAGQWVPKEVNIENPAFDVTPGVLVTKYILDRGVFTEVSQCGQ